MDKLEKYRQILQEVVLEYAADWKPRDGTLIEPVADTTNGHFQIVRSGWKEGRFVHSCLVHFALRNQKVHLLKNDTEVEWDRVLIERGVASEDVVLALRHATSAELPAAV